MPKLYASHDRKSTKRAEVRREHRDKYANERVDPEDRVMQELLACLVAKFNGEEAAQ